MSVKTLDFRDEIRAIWEQHADDHRSPAYREALARFWGFTEEDTRHNEAGVLLVRDTEVLYEKRPVRVDITVARTPRGLWLYGFSWMSHTCGEGFSPSVCNVIAFNSYSDARQAAIEKIIERFRNIAQQTQFSTQERRAAEKVIDHLEAEITPQLSLFDHFQRGG